jgi:hypothetical protein
MQFNKRFMVLTGKEKKRTLTLEMARKLCLKRLYQPVSSQVDPERLHIRIFLAFGVFKSICAV